MTQCTCWPLIQCGQVEGCKATGKVTWHCRQVHGLDGNQWGSWHFKACINQLLMEKSMASQNDMPLYYLFYDQFTQRKGVCVVTPWRTLWGPVLLIDAHVPLNMIKCMCHSVSSNSVWFQDRTLCVDAVLRWDLLGCSPHSVNHSSSSSVSVCEKCHQ